MNYNIQVVILAGGSGQLLYPLCEKYPKCLLPIGNKPLITYQLSILEQYGLYDIIIVSKGEFKYQTESSKIRIQTINLNDDEEIDSADALGKIADRIRGDFILMSCDSLTNVNFYDLLDFHYLNKSSLTVLMKKEDLESGKKLGKPPTSCNLNDSYDIYLINPQTSEIAHIVNKDDLDESGEFSVKRNVLIQHPRLEVMSNLFDAHIYVCNPIILKILGELQKIETVSVGNFKDEFLTSIVRFTNNENFKELTKSSSSEQLFANREKSKKFQIQAFIRSDIYCRRVNNLKDYMQANWESMIRGDKAINLFDQNVPLSKRGNSIIEDEKQIKDSVKIQRSIIGKNCVIQDNVKISNSIIMNDVIIHSGCSIQNSVISINTQVQTNASLENCFAGPHSVIEPNSKNFEETFIQYD